MQQLALFYAVCASTSDCFCQMLYDIIHYNDVTSVLGSYVFRRYIHFTGVQILNNFFSLTYQLAKLFECPS